MKCPFCYCENLKVVDSRPVEDMNGIKRRRACEGCNKRFTTYEKVETIPFMVIKKDNTREAYDRSKIEKGILLACHKRPISSDRLSEVIEAVENKIFSLEKTEIDSKIIGELIMKALKELDAVAYVRFASVYREFKDINTFMEELIEVSKDK